MELIQHVYYINLDHRTDRREQIEKELNQMGLSFTRIPAIREKHGHLGCSKSHLLAVQKAILSGYERVLICEDDMMWTVSKERLQTLLTQISGLSFDVFMLAINKIDTKSVADNPGLEKVIEGITCAGFIIRKSWMPIWKRLLEASIKGLETDLNPRYCCDQIWRSIQEDSEFYCFKEKVAGQREGYSDICEGYVKYDC